jgi:hypothetical protein
MTESIRRQLVVPAYVSAIHMAVGLGMLAAGIALVAASSSPRVAEVAPVVELSETASPAPVTPPRAAVAASEQAAPIADEIKLVFHAGGASYLRLADLDRDDEGRILWPRHAAPRLVQEDSAQVAIAAVDAADVPALHRSWLGRQVVVDGACRAKVTGFAVVSRLVGDPSYAGLAKDVWDVASVMQTGAQLLAARLDGCRGAFARDAALAPVVVPEPVRDERLARAAESALLASAPAAEVGKSWNEAKPAGAEGAWWDHAELSTRVLRHPQTRTTFVAVHAHTEQSCGGPDINLWGLYRVGADGTLSPVHERRFEHLYSIDRIVDVEGDGELELLGRSWLGDDVVLTTAGGRELDRLDMQFYGCPC